MKTYIAEIEKLDDVLEAENIEEVKKFILNQLNIQEACPHCLVPLQNKMIDIDGTNLEEHDVCEKCKYGYPAMR
jgi:superfamily II helicase